MLLLQLQEPIVVGCELAEGLLIGDAGEREELLTVAQGALDHPCLFGADAAQLLGLRQGGSATFDQFLLGSPRLGHLMEHGLRFVALGRQPDVSHQLLDAGCEDEQLAFALLKLFDPGVALAAKLGDIAGILQDRLHLADRKVLGKADAAESVAPAGFGFLQGVLGFGQTLLGEFLPGNGGFAFAIERDEFFEIAQFGFRVAEAGIEGSTAGRQLGVELVTFAAGFGQLVAEMVDLAIGTSGGHVGLFLHEQLEESGSSEQHSAKHAERQTSARLDDVERLAEHADANQQRADREQPAQGHRLAKRSALEHLGFVAVEVELLGAARELVESLFELDPAAKQGDLFASRPDGFADIRNALLASSGFYLGGNRIGFATSGVGLAAGLFERFTRLTNHRCRATKDRERILRYLIEAIGVDALLLGGATELVFDVELDLRDVVRQFEDLLVERDDPLRMLVEGLNARRLVEQQLVDLQTFGFVLEFLPANGDQLELLPAFEDSLIQFFQTLESIFGEWFDLAHRPQFTLDLLASLPRSLNVERSFDQTRRGVAFFDRLFERGRFVGQRVAFRGEFRPFFARRGKLVHLGLQLVPAFEQFEDFAVLLFAEETGAGLSDLAGDVDERDAVEAGGEFVEVIGRRGVVERTEFLDFAQAEGEDVLERRFIDAREQFREFFGTAGASLAIDDGQFAAVVLARVERHPTLTDVLTGRIRYEQPAPRFAAVGGRQVAQAALRREAVEHGAHELHQRGLAGFVRAVDDQRVGGQFFQLEAGPGAEAVDIDLFNSHRGCSLPAVCSCRRLEGVGIGRGRRYFQLVADSPRRVPTPGAFGCVASSCFHPVFRAQETGAQQRRFSRHGGPFGHGRSWLQPRANHIAMTLGHLFVPLPDEVSDVVEAVDCSQKLAEHRVFVFPSDGGYQRRKFHVDRPDRLLSGGEVLPQPGKQFRLDQVTSLGDAWTVGRDLPGYEHRPVFGNRAEVFDPLTEGFLQVGERGVLFHLHRVALPTNAVCRNKLHASRLIFGHMDERAAVSAGLGSGASLRSPRVVNDAAVFVPVLAVGLTAEGPVVDVLRTELFRVDFAVSYGNRKQSPAVDAEIFREGSGRIDSAAPNDRGDRFIALDMSELFLSRNREHLHAAGQLHAGGPMLQSVGRARGPVDGHALGFELLELIEEEGHGPRRAGLRIEQIAREQYEGDPLAEGGVEHALSGRKRGFGDNVFPLVRQLGQSAERLVETQVAGVQKSKRWGRHELPPQFLDRTTGSRSRGKTSLTGQFSGEWGNRLRRFDFQRGSATGSSRGRRLLAHAKNQLFQNEAGTVLLGVTPLHGEVGFDQPAVELAGPIPTELLQAVFGLFDRTDRPVPKTGGDQGVAQAGAIAAAFGLLEELGRGGIAPERPGDGAEQSQRVFAGLEQAVQHLEGFAGVADHGRINQVPGALRPPAAHDLLHGDRIDLLAVGGKQGKLGEVLVKQRKDGAGQIEQQLSGIAPQLKTMMLMSPGHDPVHHRRFVRHFRLALQPLRWTAIDLQPGLLDRFVKSSIRRPFIDFEHERSAATRSGDEVFQLRPIRGDKLVRRPQHDQLRPAAPKERLRGKLVHHVAPFRHPLLAIERRVRSIRVVAESRSDQPLEGELLQERLIAEKDANRRRLGGPGRSEIVENSDGGRHGCILASQPQPDSRRTECELLEELLDRRQNLFRPCHAAFALLAATEPAFLGIDHVDAVVAKLRHIALNGRLVPHFAVHRRSQQHRLREGEVQRRKQIVGQAVGRLGHEMGRRRCDDQQIAAFRQLDVSAERILGVGEHVLRNRTPGQRGKRRRADELLRRRGHDDGDFGPFLNEATDQHRRFVGGDASGHTDDDFPALHKRNLQIAQVELHRLARALEVGHANFVRSVQVDLVLDDFLQHDLHLVLRAGIHERPAAGVQLNEPLLDEGRQLKAAADLVDDSLFA